MVDIIHFTSNVVFQWKEYFVQFDEMYESNEIQHKVLPFKSGVAYNPVHLVQFRRQKAKTKVKLLSIM